MKADEGEEARGQSVPRMPSKEERQAHELTHFPYQPWCQHCIAGRGRDDYHLSILSDKHASRQEGMAEMPVILMDFCFSRGDEEVDVEVKEDLRIYQGDLRGGTCLVACVFSLWAQGQGKPQPVRPPPRLAKPARFQHLVTLCFQQLLSHLAF